MRVVLLVMPPDIVVIVSVLLLFERAYVASGIIVGIMPDDMSVPQLISRVIPPAMQVLAPEHVGVPVIERVVIVEDQRNPDWVTPSPVQVTVIPPALPPVALRLDEAVPSPLRVRVTVVLIGPDAVAIQVPTRGFPTQPPRANTIETEANAIAPRTIELFITTSTPVERTHVDAPGPPRAFATGDIPTASEGIYGPARGDNAAAPSRSLNCARYRLAGVTAAPNEVHAQSPDRRGAMEPTFQLCAVGGCSQRMNGARLFQKTWYAPDQP
jgi:hypothetical protein